MVHFSAAKMTMVSWGNRACNLALGIDSHACIDHCVRNLISGLVKVTLVDRLAGEKQTGVCVCDPATRECDEVYLLKCWAEGAKVRHAQRKHYATAG